MVENVRHAQRYDIQLMLFVLPHVLFAAITAPEPSQAAATVSMPDSAAGPGAGSNTPGSEIQVDGRAASAAILLEIWAVAEKCCPEGSAEQTLGCGRPVEALHLQAIMSALDSLHQCVLAAIL